MSSTMVENDRRFANKDKAYLKATTFPDHFSQKVNLKKVNLQVFRTWVAKKTEEYLGFEDEVVVEFVMGLLEEPDSPSPDPRKIQALLLGFLATHTAPFASALWTLLLSAQDSPGGVPVEFVEEKKKELRAADERDRAAASGMYRNQGPGGPPRGGGVGGGSGGRGGFMSRAAERPGYGGGGGGHQPERSQDQGYGQRRSRFDQPGPPPPQRDYGRPSTRDRSPAPRGRSRTRSRSPYRAPRHDGRRDHRPSPPRRRSPSPRPRERRRSPSPPLERRYRSRSRSRTPPRKRAASHEGSLSKTPPRKRSTRDYTPTPPPEERR